MRATNLPQRAHRLHIYSDTKIIGLGTATPTAVITSVPIPTASRVVVHRVFIFRVQTRLTDGTHRTRSYCMYPVSLCSMLHFTMHDDSPCGRTVEDKCHIFFFSKSAVKSGV